MIFNENFMVILLWYWLLKKDGLEKRYIANLSIREMSRLEDLHPCWNDVLKENQLHYRILKYSKLLFCTDILFPEFHIDTLSPKGSQETSSNDLWDLWGIVTGLLPTKDVSGRTQFPKFKKIMAILKAEYTLSASVTYYKMDSNWPELNGLDLSYSFWSWLGLLGKSVQCMHLTSVGNVELKLLTPQGNVRDTLNLFLTSKLFAGCMSILHGSLGKRIFMCSHVINSSMFVVVESKGYSYIKMIVDRIYGWMEIKDLR